MTALLTASLFFEILVHVLNCISESARKLCSATLSVHTYLQCHEDVECTRFPVNCPQECGEEEIPREEVNKYLYYMIN